MSDAPSEKPKVPPAGAGRSSDPRHGNQEAGRPSAGVSFSFEKEETSNPGDDTHTRGTDIPDTNQAIPVAAAASVEGMSYVEFDQLIKDCNLTRLRYKCGLCGKDKVKNKGGVDIPHFCPELEQRIGHRRRSTQEETMPEQVARFKARGMPKDTEATSLPAPCKPIFHSSCEQVIAIDNQGVPCITNARIKEILAEAQRRMQVDTDAERQGQDPPYASRFLPESRQR